MDRLYLKDPGGLLTVDAVRELAPPLLAAAGERPLELHSHCTIGLAPQVYVEGVRAGFDTVHTASGPLGRGTSQPEALNTARNLEAAGFAARARPRAAGASSPSTSPSSPPPRACRPVRRGSSTPPITATSCPAGMVTTTRRMLAELRRPELFDAVLEEVTRVRAEMGYPIIVTPVSQFIASQAARNVIDGERWANVSDETVRFFLGHYGDAARAGRSRRSPTGCWPAPRRPSSPTCSRSPWTAPRQKFGPRISEEELLLRLTMPAEQVDAMVAARDRDGRGHGPLPAARPGRSPLVTLLAELERRPSLTSVEVSTDDERVVWRRG